MNKFNISTLEKSLESSEANPIVRLCLTIHM
jgi:hypothetical protein